MKSYLNDSTQDTNLETYGLSNVRSLQSYLDFTGASLDFGVENNNNKCHPLHFVPYVNPDSIRENAQNQLKRESFFHPPYTPEFDLPTIYRQESPENIIPDIDKLEQKNSSY